MTRQAFAVAASNENITIAVGTSKKTSNTPSMIMPPAMPNTPETNDATKTAVPIKASEASGMPSPGPEQHGGAHQIDDADGEDDETRPLPEAVIGHALDHERRQRGGGDRQDDGRHAPAERDVGGTGERDEIG